MINVTATELTNNRNKDTLSMVTVCNKYTSLQAAQPWLCHVSEDGGEEDFVAIAVAKPKTSRGHGRVSHVPWLGT